MTELLAVQNLSLHFPIRAGVFKRQIGSIYAVNNISFSLQEAETFSIVGESGCGKSTLGRTLVQIYKPTAGSILFRGQDVSSLSAQDRKSLRPKIQMIFQDPRASLNQRMTIASILEEPFLLHGMRDRNLRRNKVSQLMELVGLSVTDMNKFPHEFSGGQRQRIGIARAVALQPSLIICDEAVSALDVSIQAQILNLLLELQAQFKLSYIFISHDLNVVRYISDQVAVMYLGRFMELAPTEHIYNQPAHPYTQALLNSTPKLDPRQITRTEVLTGDVPSAKDPPAGCPFHTRCPSMRPRCQTELPQLRPLARQRDHFVACHYAEELQKKAQDL